MLSYILAIIVGLGSLSLYLTTFFVPHLHRKDDFILSGIGLFYALVLWTCAGRITGGVLLGQVAGVALISWFVWESLSLRGILVKPDPETVISEVAKSKIEEISLSNLFNQIVNKFNQKSVITNIPTPSIAVDNNVESMPENLAESLVFSEENEVIESKEEITIETEETPIIEAETSPKIMDQNDELAVENLAEIPEIKEELTTNTEDEREDSIEIKPVPSTIKIEEKKGFSFSKLMNNISGIFNKSKVDQDQNVIVNNDQEDDDFELEKWSEKKEDQINLNEMTTEIDKVTEAEVNEVTQIEDQVIEIQAEIEDEVIETQAEIKPEINQITSELTELKEANITEEISLDDVMLVETEIIENNEDQVIIEDQEENKPKDLENQEIEDKK